MKFLFSFLFVLGICCAQNSFAYTPCTLPAPKNLQVLNQTPTSLQVRWDAVPGAIGYEIECKNANNAIVSVQSFSTPTSASFNIEPNMDYIVTTRSIFSNCEVGDEVSSLSVTGKVLIVVDLIPISNEGLLAPTSTLVYSLPAPTNGLVINTGLVPDQTYYYQFNAVGWGLVEGTISQKSDNGYVKFKRSNSSLWDLIGMLPNNEGFSMVSHQSPGFSGISSSIGIYFSYNLSEQLQFEAFHESSISNFKIYKIGGTEGAGGGTGGSEGENPVKEHSSSDKPTENTPVIIAPNPCTDHLNVLLPQTPESQVTVKIFDITGKLQQTNSLQLSDITYRAFEVNTSELRPGIYIMQIDNGSKEITTHKVVKI